MIDFVPCPACGHQNIYLGQLGLDDNASWFVRCLDCNGVTTITHARKETAITEWNNMYCWQEITKLNKVIEELKGKEKYSLGKLTEDQATLKFKFEKLMEAMIKMKLDYSGSWGNLQQEKRREIIIEEIKSDLSL